MTRKRVDQDKLLRLHASASVTVGSDDSLIFFRPSRMHRRMRAEVGPRVLRKLAIRPLAKCEQIATAQERAQDIMMTELTRLRIKPEKKKRAHDDRERLALRVLATTIDTTRTFTQFDKEIGSIDHVTEPPALDEALQARQDTDARERTQRMRQFVQEHVDKMPLQVLRVGDHIEIGISGVASLKQLKTLEKHPVNLNTLHGHRGKARELMRGRTMSQVLANAGFGDFMGTVVVRDVTSGRQVLRCRRQCIASVRAGQREVAKEHMLTSEKGWAKTCGTERAFNQGYAVAMFRRCACNHPTRTREHVHITHIHAHAHFHKPPLAVFLTCLWSE